ncbi:hypothetical protein BGX33_011714 [Mortierella sp. NVP41]|nr:hypothetical protein BGX33_011714 [Mortierella sp. NVP41]
MSTTAATPFVCQETFRLDNTTSCMRYDKVKRCMNEGTASNIPFLCVAQDTISIGGGGPMNKLPLNLTSSVFLCNLGACPNAAPAKEPKPNKKNSKGDGNIKNSNNRNATNNGPSSFESLSLSGVFVLALIVSQIVLY